MRKSIKTSQTSRYKLEFNGEENCWYIYDKKYNDFIRVSPDRIEAKRSLENFRNGCGFGDCPVPDFLKK